ncbi:hypothetical protein I4U23_024419 [Adineta vaga]|nr:hypothetical protein I4U23_024419 [Adineta vaga]
MLSTESQAQNQQQQSTAYDERVFNERIRQLFNPIDSSLSPNDDIGQMTSIVDALFPEQATMYQQQKQRDQRHASTNDLTTSFDRFPLWSTNTNTNTNTTSSNSSASAFCGGTTSGSSAFANRRQAKLHSSTRSLRNGNYHQQQQSQQQQHHYRPPPLTRPRFTSSTIRIPSAAATTIPNGTSSTNGLQRSSSSLSTNAATNGTTEYQPRFASRLSSTRLPTVAPPVGSHDQIAGNTTSIDSIAPPSTIGVMGQPSSASAVLARSTSSTNAQPQQFVTMTQTTTTTFCYVPASGSLAYNALPGAARSAAVPHH